MGLTNNELHSFIEALKRMDINYTNEDSSHNKQEIYISLNYNGFDQVAHLATNLINHFEKTKKEILNNLLLFTGTKEKEDYIKILWFTYLEIDKDLMKVADLFLEGGSLSENLKDWEWGTEGEILEDREIKVILPEEGEFEIISDENFLGDCYEIQHRFLGLYMRFIFSLCQNQNINIEIPTESVYEFVKRQSIKTVINKNTSKKLKWLGTPGEFGAIFNKLFETGHMEYVKDTKHMVRVLNEIFEIKSDKSTLVNNNYLYKCFKEKEKKYFPDQLKIPRSDNSHSAK